MQSTRDSMKTKTLLTLLCALLALTGAVAFLRYALMMTFRGGFAASAEAGGVFREATGELAASGLAFGSIAFLLAAWQLRRVFLRWSTAHRRDRLVLPTVLRSGGQLLS